MATYKIKAPDGRTVSLTGDAPPTEQEIEQVFSSIGEANQGKQEASDPLKTYKTENVGDAFNNIFVRPGAGVRNLIRGGSYMQGFDNPNSVQTFQNQALDNFYRSGFLSEHPMLKEALGIGVSAGGLAADIATNPADVLGMLLGKAPIKGTGTTLGGEIAGSQIGQTVGRMANAPLGAQTVNPRLTQTPGAIERLQSMQASKKGRAEVSKLLTDLKLSSDISQNKPTNALAEGFNLIKKTNNPVEVADKFRIEKDGIIKQVNQLVENYNKPVNPDFIIGRLKVLLQKEMKHGDPSDIRKIKSEINNQVAWLSKQKNLDTKTLNERKRYLYEQTQPLQGKQAEGKTILKSPKKDLVRDKFAQVYREAIEEAHPDIRKLNSRFDGLQKGLDAASKMAERLMEQGSPLERIMTQTIGRPNVPGVAAAAVREIPQMLKSLGRTTGNIESLSKKSAELLNQSRMKQAESLIASFMNKQKMDMSNAEYFKNVFTPDDAFALTAIQPKLIGSSGSPKQIEGSVGRLGENFKLNTREQGLKAVGESALDFKKKNPMLFKERKIDIEKVTSGDKGKSVKKVGIDPKTSRLKEPKITTAAEKAKKGKNFRGRASFISKP